MSSDGFLPFSRSSGEDVNFESRISTNDSSRKMGSVTSSADGNLDRIKNKLLKKDELDELVDSRTCEICVLIQLKIK